MKKIRIVVVDDSAFSRRSISRILESMDFVEVVGYATNGEEGIQKVIALKPDLLTLDLDMPKMDGFTLLRILKTRFSLPVIVISALGGADKIFKALELGALDFVAKPSSSASIDLLNIKEDLQHKIRHFFSHTQTGQAGSAPEAAESTATPKPTVEKAGTSGHRTVNIVAIGSSTGGPPALQHIFSTFDRQFPFAIVVAQHMPAGFTKAFAERLNRSSCFDIKEAEDGDLVLPGTALITPGGKNMLFEVQGEQVRVRIVKPSASDRYIPSVDVMFHSCAEIFRSSATAVVLTGMGNDGSDGVRIISEYGGYVIAESEITAIVYGMPREAVATGVVDRCVPLERIAAEIITHGGFS